MRIVVIGGSGLIGSKLVAKLAARGHEAVPASPKSGVNTLTGEGLAEVCEGASVVVDVSNSPSFEDAPVMRFFETSTRNLLDYETAAGVAHHVALSVVGTDRLLDSGYFRAKLVQEKLIKQSPIPYSIVRATQFFQFLKSIADGDEIANVVHVAPVLIQPIAADDVASALCTVAIEPPLNATVEVAGPDRFLMAEFIRRGLDAAGDSREVVADPSARYFGAALSEYSLIPGEGARLGATHLEDWLYLTDASPRLRAPAVPAAALESHPSAL